MSTLDVVAEILREVAPRALRAKQIAELAAGRLPSESKTPETVISRDLAIDIRDHGETSRFLRAGRGEFLLKEALPTALYNELEPYAAAWSRNLVAAGQIAAGVVDERSIRDLKPADVASYRQCHFFSGISVWSRALRDAGIPDDFNVWTGSAPCQPWSSAGQRKGHADDRDLWPEWFRLIKACRPALLFGEQVASKDGLHWFDAGAGENLQGSDAAPSEGEDRQAQLHSVRADLEGIGYVVWAADLPACSVGAPHRRQRLYFVAYARERGREILSAAWLHDRGQRGHDALGCGAVDLGVASLVSDTAGSRCKGTEDVGPGCGDAGEGSTTLDWGTAGDFEFERGGAPDGSSAGGEFLVGGSCGCLGGGSSELGDAGLDGDWQHAGELSGDEAQHEERTTQRDHASVLAGAAHGTSDEGGMVRGATCAAGDRSIAESSFRPGDRIRIGDDASWGGSVRGFWERHVEWIYCRPTPGNQNGCFRPTESGTQPLVDGTAADMGRTRTKRLRAYGNSIVLPLATEFVGAVIDTLADAAREGAA